MVPEDRSWEAGVVEWIVVGAIAVVVVVAAGVMLSVSARRRVRAVEREVAAAHPDARLLVPRALLFGRRSDGLSQIRGNGTLVLTDDELLFELGLPRRHYRVPLDAVESVETPTSFLTKTQFAPLLQVNYRDDRGQLDAIAWRVPDLEGARRSIEEAMAR